MRCDVDATNQVDGTYAQLYCVPVQANVTSNIRKKYIDIRPFDKTTLKILCHLSMWFECDLLLLAVHTYLPGWFVPRAGHDFDSSLPSYQFTKLVSAAMNLREEGFMLTALWPYYCDRAEMVSTMKWASSLICYQCSSERSEGCTLTARCFLRKKNHYTMPSCAFRRCTNNSRNTNKAEGVTFHS